MREAAEYIGLFLLLVFMSLAVPSIESWLLKKLGMQRRSSFIRIADLEKIEHRLTEDPGPLDTSEKLLLALVSPSFPASKHTDRIQDAVAGLLHDREVAVLAIQNLARECDWMGYQLGAASSTAVDERSRKLLDEQLATLSETYNALVIWQMPTLVAKVSVLARIVPELVDTELVMTVFRCDVDPANMAIRMSTELEDVHD